MFIALAGNFFLSQNRPIPIPKRTIKLEVIKKIPPSKTDSIKEIKRQRIESFEPVKHAGLPKTQKPLEILENTDLRQKTPVLEQKKPNPQPVNQSVSARKSVASLVSKATRAPHKNLNPKSVQAHSVPKIATTSEGQLINSRAERVNTALLPKKTTQPGTVDKKGTSKTGIFSSGAKRFASIAIEPRSVPDISQIDPRAAQDYSSEIQRKISSKIKYPKRAKRKGKQGQVTVRFKVLKSGQIQDLILVARTPFKELNRAGLKAVRQAAPFPRLPEGIGQDFLFLELPIRFEIN